MLTGETPETLKPGRRVDAVALRVFANEVICQVATPLSVCKSSSSIYAGVKHLY